MANRLSDRHRPGQTYTATTSSSDTSWCTRYGIPPRRALIFDEGDTLVCKSTPHDGGPLAGLVYGYIRGTRQLGHAAEGFFHPDQVQMIEIPVPSPAGAAGNRSGGSSRSQQPGDGATCRSDARRRETGSARSGGGQLFVAEVSSSESWSKYRIQEPRLLFVKGNHLVSERVSHTTGEHFGYVVDPNHPAEKRPCPDKSKGYFRPEQVKIVEELSSSSGGTRSSNMRSSPVEKRKAPDTPAVAAAAAASVGGSDPTTEPSTISRELSSKRSKIGRNTANRSEQDHGEAKFSQSLSAKHGSDDQLGKDAKVSLSQSLSTKRPSDPGTGDGPSHEGDTDAKLSRGFSVKRVKRADDTSSGISSASKIESNSTSSKANSQQKTLGSRFQPPQKQLQAEATAAKTNQARDTEVRKESSRAIASADCADAKAPARSNMVVAKKKVGASAKAQAVEDVTVSTSNGVAQTKASTTRIESKAMSAEPIEPALNEGGASGSTAAVSDGNGAFDEHDLMALRSEPPKPEDLSSSEYVQAPPAMATKARFPPGCVVIHTTPDGSTTPYIIRSVHLRLRSDHLISGSIFDVLFKVGTGEDVKVLPEDSLVYARDCPILVESDAVPHVESQNGWVRGTVKSSMKLPGAAEEDYVVTIANGGTAHVPRDTIRYRDPPVSDDDAMVQMSSEDTEPSAFAVPVSSPAPPIAIVLAPAPSSATGTATTESATEDASKASSSIATAPKKETNASASVVCRIDMPDRIDFGAIHEILAPKVERMKRRLKVGVFIVGSKMPPPRDAGVVRSFGDLFPRPQASGIYSSCVLLSGSAEYIEKARKAVIFFLKDGVYGDNIDEKNALDKELEDGFRKAKAIITKGDENGSVNATNATNDAAGASATSMIKLQSSAAPTKPAEKPPLDRLDSSRSVASKSKKAAEPQLVMIRFEVTLSSRTKHIESLFAEGTNNLVKTIEEDTNCTISMREGSKYHIKVSGIEENSVIHAAKELFDVLCESDVPEDCIKQTEGPKIPDTPMNKFLLPAKKPTPPIPIKTHAPAPLKKPAPAKPTKPTPARAKESEPEPKQNSVQASTSGSDAKASSKRQFVLPKWLKYADMDAFFESPKKKETESKIECDIRIINRIAPIRLELSSANPSKRDFWSEWSHLTEAIANCCFLGENERPIFSYDCFRDNNDGAPREQHPIMRCRTTSGRGLVYAVAIPLRNDQYASRVIGRGGINTKRIVSLGCRFKVHNVSLAGKYAHIESSGSRDEVKKARGIVEDLIAGLSGKVAGEKSETEAASLPPRAAVTAEFRMPIWISYDDVGDFFEGSQLKELERISAVHIEISDRRSPMNVVLSSSRSQDLWSEWESLIEAISNTLGHDLRSRFLYDVVMYNYAGKMERKASPVLQCKSPFHPKEKLLMAALSIPTRPKGSYAGYIVGSKRAQIKRIEKIGCTFNVYEFPSRQSLSYALVTGTIRDDVKKARDIVQEKIDECRALREIETEEDDDDEEDADVIYQPPPQESEDEDKMVEQDEPAVVFRPQERSRTISILDVGTFIGNDWAQVKRWQSKFGRRGVKISVYVREGVADVSGPEHQLDRVVREINSWQHSQRTSTPPRRRRSSGVVFGGVVAS